MNLAQVIALLTELNETYAHLHQQKEELFWTTRMGISEDFEAYTAAESALMAFTQDTEHLRQSREAHAAALELGRQDLVQTLSGWVAYFSANVIESAEGRALIERLSQQETELLKKRKAMNLGYTLPDGTFHSASSVALALKVSTAPDEATRKACFHGLESIERMALDSGFLDIVRTRNAFARSQGYQDFYDYKVSVTEGMSKQELFGYLDELERRTRAAAQALVERQRARATELGVSDPVAPWNFRYLTQGDSLKELDPYMSFADSVGRWGRSFHNMGVKFDGAMLQLDLMDRKGKYENGFCHAPAVPYRRLDDSRVRAKVNFTSNAVPGQVGSGQRASETLFHEGGHAAHFANVLMGAPCFSQEFAPSSTAMAETQSMFFDSLLGDADWRRKYANTPWEVIERSVRASQPLKAMYIRNLLIVCFAEKALYELSDADLTAENALAAFKQVEQRLTFLERCPRPTLAVPHLLNNESSAIYHGYILADCAVAQTRHFFIERDGYITDNPKVGPEMREHYWRPGNSRRFRDFIASLTGKPFSVDAYVADVTASTEEALAEERRLWDLAERVPTPNSPVEMDMTLRVVHGAEVIASTETASFEQVAERFREWVVAQG